MEAGKIRAVLREKAAKIDKLYFDVSPAFDKEVIHEFRTETKKLRALLSLISTAGKKKLQPGRRYRHVYHISGALRDVQLLQDMITEEWKQPLHAFFAQLNLELMQLKTAWECCYRPNLIGKIHNKLKGETFHDIHPRQFRNMVEDGLKSLRSLDETSSDEALHKARKSIKELVYNVRLAEDEWTEGYKELEGLPLMELKPISDLLGSYNDNRLNIMKLETFKSPAVSGEERGLINGILHEGRARLMRQKSELIEALGQLG